MQQDANSLTTVLIFAELTVFVSILVFFLGAPQWC